jgi:Arc/MetJ-type ribon-helix-helix transcriptional regulator
MTDESSDNWDSPEGKAKRIAQAQALRDQARAGGLRFEAYLPPDLADWLLAHIERGTFKDPSEAVFVILGEHEELEPHADLRGELLKRVLQAAANDPRPGAPVEEVRERLRARAKASRPEPAVWRTLP